MNNTIKLIYIASNGRSGSTLMEMILSAHSQVETLGEFQRLFIDYKYYGTSEEKKMGAQVCGCGKELTACDFWQDIVNHFNDNSEQVKLFNHFRSAPHIQGKAIRFEDLKEIFCNKTTRIKTIDTYNHINTQILHEVQKKISANSPSTYLIDSSKDIYRLAWLSHSSEIDIKVIHVIKECPAFAYSMIKKISGTQRAVLFSRKVIRWAVENSLIRSVCKRKFTPENHIEIKYEVLAENPQKVIGEITNWLNLPSEDNIAVNFRHAQHGISGNQMRHESRPIIKDEKWKKELPFIYKNISKSVQFFYSVFK